MDADRTDTTPCDIVLNGQVAELDRSQTEDRLLPLIDSGATWWIEGLWQTTKAVAVERIRRGPPSREL